MYHVVIVDDEYWALKGISRTFKWEEYGFKVIAELTSPQKAFDLIKQEKPEVLFTDVRMPEIMGLDLIKILRQGNIDLEIVIVSGYSEFEYARQALQHRVFDYCLKPIRKERADEILSRLSCHLNEKKTKNDGLKSEPENPVSGSKVFNKTFDELLKYVNDNYNSKLKLKDIADKFYMNPNYCSDLFKKCTGETFSNCITKLRMQNAVQLLRNTAMTIGEIAEKIGYDDPHYFDKVFRKVYKLTPGQYRRINSRFREEDL